VDEETYQGMVEAVPKCISLIHDCQEVDVVRWTLVLKLKLKLSLLLGFGPVPSYCVHTSTHLLMQACGYALGFCNEALAGPYAASGLNTYDVRCVCVSTCVCVVKLCVERGVSLDWSLVSCAASPHHPTTLFNI
jgi:hypothetical protein